MTSSSGRICGSRARRMCYGSDMSLRCRPANGGRGVLLLLAHGAAQHSTAQHSLAHPPLNSFSAGRSHADPILRYGREMGIQAVAGHTEGPNSPILRGWPPVT